MLVQSFYPLVGRTSGGLPLHSFKESICKLQCLYRTCHTIFSCHAFVLQKVSHQYSVFLSCIYCFIYKSTDKIKYSTESRWWGDQSWMLKVAQWIEVDVLVFFLRSKSLRKSRWVWFNSWGLCPSKTFTKAHHHKMAIRSYCHKLHLHWISIGLFSHSHFLSYVICTNIFV